MEGNILDVEMIQGSDLKKLKPTVKHGDENISYRDVLITHVWVSYIL